MGATRDRHGRGRRGPVAWPALPLMLTRSEQFDGHVVDALRRYRPTLGRLWDHVEVAVEEVPPGDPAPWEDGPAVARLFPAEGGLPHRIVVYRRPVESLAARQDDLVAVLDLLMAQHVAAILGVDVEDIDPELG
ncbi:metallopeptidase family protein [Marihabitans asiaticum]|uniref:Zinicin-like metallopeptidase n=1 Tax=Marihabitans asiaticum TaxID=415218 RepID=A0A560WCR6_9MICO|nr:metallopeptidase family protein [Marihabitans asiaticum]TWD15427.1 zinicin-like metallopeptidase [Marihabitans asiaticum]